MADADVRAAAATTDTNRAALLTIATAGGPRVLASLVDGCMQGEAGAARMKDTGRGLGESPEGGHAPNPHLREKPATRRRLPITPRKKCDGHTPHPAPGPHPDHALGPVLGPDPGPDASREAVRTAPAAPFLSVVVSD